MLCHAVLICTVLPKYWYYRNIDIHWYLLYYRNDLNCAMSGDWNGEISWFVPPLSLSQLCQPNHKKQFIKKLLSNSECGISKTNFLTTRQLFSLIITKRVVLTLWCHVVVPKGQTYLDKPTAKSFGLF